MRKSLFSGKKENHTFSENYHDVVFSREKDLILKVHAEENRQSLMELKPRVTLLIKIGTSQKFNIKVIISEILVLKQSFADCLNIFGGFEGVCYIREGISLAIFNCELDWVPHSGDTPLLFWGRGNFNIPTNVSNIICTTLCDYAYDV